MGNIYRDKIIELATLRNNYNSNPSPELEDKIVNIYSAIYTMYVNSLYHVSHLSGAAKRHGYNSNIDYAEYLKENQLYNETALEQVFGVEKSITL